MNIIDLEKPVGVIASLGGQTAVNLAKPLAERGVRIIGTDDKAIERAEDRDIFEEIIKELDIPHPSGVAVTDIESGVAAAAEIGYPVLVRPSFVLGGRAMEIVANEEMLRRYLKNAFDADPDSGWQTDMSREVSGQADSSCEELSAALSEEHDSIQGEKHASRKPVLVDRYIVGKEVEIDAICDGQEVFLPGIMELVERTGVHSGDSTSVYPPFSISEKVKDKIRDYTTRIGLGIGIIGLFNIQFIVADKHKSSMPAELSPVSEPDAQKNGTPYGQGTRQGESADEQDEEVYIIEVNPRASRSVPFLSKSTGLPLVSMATKVMMGMSLRSLGIEDMYYPEKELHYVKAPAFSFEKLQGMDAYLSPEMKSTGEAIGYDKSLKRAFYKAMQASGIKMKQYGTVVVTLADEDKEEALPLIERFYKLGFNIEATVGTGVFLKEHGVRTRIRGKLSEGSDEILKSISTGYVSYIINTRAILSGIHYEDGVAIRRHAVANGVTMFTSLDTVRILLDVLEEVSPHISAI